MKEPEDSVPKEETELSEEDKQRFGNPEDFLPEDEVDTSVIEEEDEEIAEKEPEDTLESEEPEDEDKTKAWTREDAIKAYKNAEKAMGSMGKELGDLRKQATTPTTPIATTTEPKEYTTADIPDLPDSELDNFIAVYKAQLANPDLPIEDGEMFAKLNLEYHELKAEKATRTAMQRMGNKDIARGKEALVNEFKKANDISDDDIVKIKATAERLSDDGAITKVDLEAAYLKLRPDQYRQKMAAVNAERLAKAKAQSQPRLPSGNSNADAVVMTAKKFLQMSEFDQTRFLETATIEDVERLDKEIHKR
jgi:hypothetical protein